MIVDALYSNLKQKTKYIIYLNNNDNLFKYPRPLAIYHSPPAILFLLILLFLVLLLFLVPLLFLLILFVLSLLFIFLFWLHHYLYK